MKDIMGRRKLGRISIMLSNMDMCSSIFIRLYELRYFFKINKGERIMSSPAIRESVAQAVNDEMWKESHKEIKAKLSTKKKKAKKLKKKLKSIQGFDFKRRRKVKKRLKRCRKQIVGLKEKLCFLENENHSLRQSMDSQEKFFGMERKMIQLECGYEMQSRLVEILLRESLPGIIRKYGRIDKAGTESLGKGNDIQFLP